MYNDQQDGIFNQFSTKNQISSSSSTDFLQSNSLVAKFAFLILVLLGFILLLRLGLSLLAFFFQDDKSPRLINGMVPGNQTIVFQQDPSNNGAVTIYRSVNATDGIEFTWSTWIYIDNLQYLQGQYRNIFYKGNSNFESTGLNFPNNAPGLYITPNSNSLVVMMNTYNVINEEILIPDIPLNKWLNVIIRCQNTTLDVYINGTIVRSVTLAGIPKQNYGNVYVAANGGFGGYLSNLWYYNYALGTSEIQRIAMSGPNTKLASSSSMNVTKNINNNYLSLRWYFAGAGDAYNPALPPSMSNK